MLHGSRSIESPPTDTGKRNKCRESEMYSRSGHNCMTSGPPEPAPSGTLGSGLGSCRQRAWACLAKEEGGAAMDIIEHRRVSPCAAGVHVWRNCRKRGSNGGVTVTLAFAFGDEPTNCSH
jgi:hypothetical protein